MQFNPANTNISMALKVDDLADTNATKYPLAQKARAFNTALDRAYSLIFSFTDTKNYDDRNYSTLPQGTYDITAGERNLTVFKDEDGAEILKIHLVMAKDTLDNWYRLEEMDIRDRDAFEIAEGDEVGRIDAYDWVGNSLVFDKSPEEDIAGGIKVFYMRNSTYFDADDTTKEPGLPAIYHMYPIYYAAWEYCSRKGLQRASAYEKKYLEMEQDMKKYFSSQTITKNTRIAPMANNVW